MTTADPVPAWVHFADVPPTDDEPWRWTCGSCGRSLFRLEIPQHRAWHEAETRKMLRLVRTLAVVALVALVVVLVRWPR